MVDPELGRVLRQARRVAVLTGAGISAESGVPTFREARSGLWRQFDPEELATLEAFQRNPARVWEWYAHRRALVAAAEPGPAHLALAEWGERLEWCRIITQNVDGFHQRAGSREVIELHGNINRSRCADCGGDVEGEASGAEMPPHCVQCGGLLRPDVVWFGEALPPGAYEAAAAAVAQADLMLSVGTSSLVQPAASLPLEALERGVPVVEINPEVTPLTPVADWSLRGKAGEILPRLVEAAIEP